MGLYQVCIFRIVGLVLSQLCERRDNEHVIFFFTDAASKIHRVSPDVLTDGEKCARIKAILEGIFMFEDFRVAAYAKAIILLLAKAYDIDHTTIGKNLGQASRDFFHPLRMTCSFVCDVEPKIVTEVNNNTGQHRLSLPVVFQGTPGVDTTLFMHGVPIVAKMGGDGKTLTLTFAADKYYGAEKVTEDLKKIDVDFRFAVVSGVPDEMNMENDGDMVGVGEVVKSILGDLNPKSVKPQKANGGRIIVHFPDVVDQVVLMMHVQTTRQQPYRHNAIGLYLGLCEFKIHVSA